MTTDDSVFQVLNIEESREKLNSVKLGRVVVRRSDDMDIFPVNFVLDEAGRVYLRTAEGSKLFTVGLNADVLFEADEVKDGHAWSVVIKGKAEILKDIKEIHFADTLDLKPWAPTLKYNWVRITPVEVSGRAFAITEEPERY
ncbi:pyridoxamine 5'-phosphate oxidase family protein [Corynebacterium sp. A21]|uniref:pyridoxamine 5'-phosphate oxidase family protein n=1 Tax=Corynebacterium sp. A21 TaxID=3457318 RepID=UPI003FD01FF5